MIVPGPVQFEAVLQRKDPRLPVYVVVPAALVAPWALQGTTVVEGTVNGHAMGRRTLKRWDASPRANWFFELTAPLCKQAGLIVGDALRVTLALAAADVPAELQTLLRQAPALQAAWNGLTQAQQREAMEHVRAGKSSSTRERRAGLVLQGLQGP